MHIFLPIVIKVLVKRPGLIKNIFETIFYSSREGSDIRSELLVMVVAEGRRSQGVGTELVGKFEKALIQRGHREYKVTVHQEMARANHFYQKNNMHSLKEFMLYGHKWNVYAKNL